VKGKKLGRKGKGDSGNEGSPTGVNASTWKKLLRKKEEGPSIYGKLRRRRGKGKKPSSPRISHKKAKFKKGGRNVWKKRQTFTRKRRKKSSTAKEQEASTKRERKRVKPLQRVV